MLNEIIVKSRNSKIIKIEKSGKYNLCYLENGDVIPITKIEKESKVLIKCAICEKYTEIDLYGGKYSPLKRIYVCMSCNKVGSKNPFYGKKHSEEFKKELSENRKGLFTGKDNWMFGKNVWEMYDEQRTKEIKKKISDKVKGEKNPFYGKTHSSKTMDRIARKNKKFWKTISDEERKKISETLSLAQKDIYDRNPEKYIENKKKANRVSLESQKRFKMNKIEKVIDKELKSRKLGFKYSAILGFKQFDFGNKEYKILLEIQGDYWHGNPDLFGDEEGKIKLNGIQKDKQLQDIEKEEFAKKHNFILYKIWEDEIKNGKYKIIIDEIEKLIKERKNGIKKI